MVEELKEDEWNLNELERLQQEQVPLADIRHMPMQLLPSGMS